MKLVARSNMVVVARCLQYFDELGLSFFRGNWAYISRADSFYQSKLKGECPHNRWILFNARRATKQRVPSPIVYLPKQTGPQGSQVPWFFLILGTFYNISVRFFSCFWFCLFVRFTLVFWVSFFWFVFWFLFQFLSIFDFLFHFLFFCFSVLFPKSEQYSNMNILKFELFFLKIWTFSNLTTFQFWTFF
jgi:hypothetical protein